GKIVGVELGMKVKAWSYGTNIVEVSFEFIPPNWEERLKALPEVESVSGRDNLYRIATRNGPATTMALLDAAAQINLPVLSLSVQSTTLDDVFVYYTGRQLRDALQEASPGDSSFVMRR